MTSTEGWGWGARRTKLEVKGDMEGGGDAWLTGKQSRWRGVGGWCPERGASVSPSSLPSPLPLPCLASVCRSAGHGGESAWEQTAGRGPGPGGVGRGRGGVRGRPPVGTESRRRSRPAPAAAGEARGKACWENGGLSGRRGRPGRGPGDQGLSAWVGGRTWSPNQEKAALRTRGRGFGPATKYANSTVLLVSSE